MRVVALEVGVQVGAPVDWVLETMQAGAIVHVLRGGRHLEDVPLVQIVELDAAAVEGCRWNRLTVELDGLDRGADEFDEGGPSGTRAVERHTGAVVLGDGDAYLLTLGQEQESAPSNIGADAATAGVVLTATRAADLADGSVTFWKPGSARMNATGGVKCLPGRSVVVPVHRSKNLSV